MKGSKTDTCPLCGSRAHLVTNTAVGYREGRLFSIYECGTCRSSFAIPAVVDDDLYGRIYTNSRNVPGYNRYYRYAQEVLNQKRALDYLCRQEESYWAVAQHLRQRRSAHDGSLRVLEIGCGLGYFAYALSQDGFNAAGVDISEKAVHWAREHYGPRYSCKTLHDLKAQSLKYDAVIMNQLIEHVPDVHAFIADALELLSPGGELLLTTPNKSAYPDAEWETELPPLHLWWLGEESMRYLAERHDCAVTLIDFESFYNSCPTPKNASTPLQTRRAVFDAKGGLLIRQTLPPVTAFGRMLEGTGIMAPLRRIRSAVFREERWRGSRGPIIAAVFKPLRG